MTLLALAAYLVALVSSIVLSAAETSVLLLSVGRIHRLAEADRRGAAALERIAELRHRLRAVAALVSGFAFMLGAWAGYSVGVSLSGFWSAGAFGAVLGAFVTHSVGLALPRTFAVTNPERVALETARFALPITQACYPVAALLGAPWKWAVELTGAERPFSPWAVTPEWRGADADEEAEREEAEEALLEAVSDFAEKVVREVMVPRTDMTSIEDTATVDEAVAVIRATGFTRLPVYHETVDDVRGVLYAKDLLAALVDCRGDLRVIELAREPYFVPETKPVEELLAELRSKTHIAIVADEYGGTAGLITLEDLLEELVGEISDEYDREEPLVVDLGDGRFRIDARLPVDDLNETFGTDIDTEVDSVGGLVAEIAGRIPAQGEAVEVDGLRLSVADLQGTRIRQLVVESAASHIEGDEDA